jgi:hypothetical protein
MLLPVLAVVALPRPATASCTAPAPGLVWVSPADGANGVPTDAAIWMLLANWYAPPEIVLNGVLVPVAEFPYLYRPGGLAPNTLYEVKVKATSDQPPVELSWTFTTGDGPSPAAAPAPPEIERVTTTRDRSFDALCMAVWYGCYDTGQDTHVLFEAAGDVPLAWVVETVPAAPQAGETSAFRLWPGVCGIPEVFTQAAAVNQCTRPYRVHAGDVSGRTAASSPVCASPTTPDPGSASGCGCAMAAPNPPAAAGWFLLIPAALAASSWRERPRRSRPTTG